MIETLYEYIVPQKLVQMTIGETQNVVKIQGKLSGTFDTRRGLKQGDALSTKLYNICLESIVRNIELYPNGTIINGTLQIMVYADDVVLVSRNRTSLEEALQQFVEQAVVMGRHVNEGKTKLVTSILMCGKKFDQVQRVRL